MTIDLEQFHAAFFEESFEALDAMEAALLELDVGAPDADRINTIFRVAHSIKGGSGMFGFDAVTSFTHSVETLLDELRSKRLEVTASIADLLFKSVDIMRSLLRGLQSHAPHDSQSVSALQFDIEQVIARKVGVAATPVAAASPIVLPAAADGNPPIEPIVVASRQEAPHAAAEHHPAAVTGSTQESGSMRVGIEN
jgi:two-component system, chemotaxis family, sensor kinase CheA